MAKQIMIFETYLDLIDINEDYILSEVLLNDNNDINIKLLEYIIYINHNSNKLNEKIKNIINNKIDSIKNNIYSEYIKSNLTIEYIVNTYEKYKQDYNKIQNKLWYYIKKNPNIIIEYDKIYFDMISTYYFNDKFDLIIMIDEMLCNNFTIDNLIKVINYYSELIKIKKKQHHPRDYICKTLNNSKNLEQIILKMIEYTKTEKLIEFILLNELLSKINDKDILNKIIDKNIERFLLTNIINNDSDKKAQMLDILIKNIDDKTILNKITLRLADILDRYKINNELEKAEIRVRNKNNHYKIENINKKLMNPIILRYSIWNCSDEYNYDKYNLLDNNENDPKLQIYIYEMIYKIKYPNRKINWNFSIGTSIIEIEIKYKTYQFLVLTLQMFVLLCLRETGKIKMSELNEKLNINNLNKQITLNNIINSLLKSGLILREDKKNDDDLYIIFNHNFESNNTKISLISLINNTIDKNTELQIKSIILNILNNNNISINELKKIIEDKLNIKLDDNEFIRIIKKYNELGCIEYDGINIKLQNNDNHVEIN